MHFLVRPVTPPPGRPTQKPSKPLLSTCLQCKPPTHSNSVGLLLCKATTGEAVEALDLLVKKGSDVDDSVFYGLLRRCIDEKDLVLGRRVHALVVEGGYESDAFLANHIICMYASHGSLDEARKVFTEVIRPNHYMWASIILAHARHGQPTQAIEFYRQLRKSPLKPNNHIFVAALKACTTAEDLVAGREVHADIMGASWRPNIYVGNCLVAMYAKCGCFEDARSVFDDLPKKDVVTWTAMLAGYAQHGLGQQALTLYASMQQEAMIPPNHVTFVCLLQACTLVKALHQGKQLHAQIQERYPEPDVVLGNCLVNMYLKCGSLEDAREVFDHLPRKTVVTWTAMISGYAKCGWLEEARRLFDNVQTRDVAMWNAILGGYVQHGHGQDALTLYACMQQEGTTHANHVTFSCLLQACTSAGALMQGKLIHSQICEEGLEDDLVIGNCLVTMYSKCGSLKDGRKVFDNLPSKNVVTWTAMISGYAEHGLGQEALALYAIMQRESVAANHVTYVCLLQACASIGALHQGKQLHAEIQERGLEADIVVGNSLVHMYATCGSLEDAQKAFNHLTTRDVVSWTAMIAGYAQHGLNQEALALYADMRQEGITPADAVTVVCLLQACGSMAGLEKGKEIHLLISEIGLESTDLFVANNLIDMYGKCGSMFDAQQVFDALPTRDVVTWSSLIAGYAREGKTNLVFDLFESMSQKGIPPNSITFLCVLTVCSHAGLVEKGLRIFESMSRDYGITPSIEHFTCLVDLLGRAGQVDKAMMMVKTMPLQPGGDLWKSVLGACQKWGDVHLGREAFECAARLDRSDASAYILMSNIYTAAGMHKLAKEIQTMRVEAQAWKKPGQSWWTDIMGVVHSFVAADTEHPAGQEVYAKLGDLSVKLNMLEYVPHFVDSGKSDLANDKLGE